MKKVIFVIPQRNFNDKEYSRTKEVLEANLVKVEVSSITEDECVGMYGLRVKPEKSVREIRVEEYDALVMIGGSGSPKLIRTHSTALTLPSSPMNLLGETKNSIFTPLSSASFTSQGLAGISSLDLL